MKLAKVVALVCLTAMSVVLVYGFARGDFFGEGSKLLAMPWGIVSLVDLYVGFTLFSGWILHREGLSFKALIWIVLMMVLGFWAGALYVLLALQSSGGDWMRFWHGKKKEAESSFLR